MNPSDVMATSAAIAIVVHATPTAPRAEFEQFLSDGTSRLLARIANNAAASTFVAGAVAGAVSRTLTAPLDRLKMLAQEGRVSTCSRQSDVQRMINLAHHVYKFDGGVKAFWRGNGINCLKAGPEYAVAFTARQSFAQVLCVDPKAPRLWENFALGALSGLTAQSILYPLEITKTRMAVAQRGEYRGVADCIGQSIQRGGVRDLYRGMGANLAGVVPHRSLEMGAFFTLETACRNALKLKEHERLPMVYLTGTGFVASVFSQVVTYPLNLARTKLQTQGVNGRPVEYSGLADCLSSVVRRHGCRGLFVGLLPNMLKAAPASTIMYTVFRTVMCDLDSRKSPSSH